VRGGAWTVAELWFSSSDVAGPPLPRLRTVSIDRMPQVTSGSVHVAYLSLQAVVDGQDTWAAVMEIVDGWRSDGWTVDTYFPDYPAGRAPGPLGRIVEMLRIQMRLARRVSEYDAVYIRAHQMAWFAARRSARRGVTVVQECNGPYEDVYIAWPQARIVRPLLDWMQRSQYRTAAAIIAVSAGLRDWLAAQSGNSHIVVSGNGANIRIFSPDARRRPGLPECYGVFFGQFAAWQGIDTLLEAARLAEWPDELALVFVGDGALRPAVQKAADETPGRIKYLGRLAYEDVAQAVAHAEVSFVPMAAPERENLFSPLKLYESMACAVPVIASDVVGISEVVRESQCGILVPSGDASAIARATVGILLDAQRARGMGERGRQAVLDRYSWQARARERAAVVKDAIDRTRPAASQDEAIITNADSHPGA
jgi:glycosyltransferase involved in cell wall biosynthesis